MHAWALEYYAYIAIPCLSKRRACYIYIFQLDREIRSLDVYIATVLTKVKAVPDWKGEVNDVNNHVNHLETVVAASFRRWNVFIIVGG